MIIFTTFLKVKPIKKNKSFFIWTKQKCRCIPLKNKKKFGKIYLKVKVFDQIHKFFSKGHHVSNILSALTVLAVMNLILKNLFDY